MSKKLGQQRSFLYNNSMKFTLIIILNLLFISFAYPFGNTDRGVSGIIFVDNSKNASYVMQKAFEAELLAKNHNYEAASEIYQEIINKSDDPEIAKRATQLTISLITTKI